MRKTLLFSFLAVFFAFNAAAQDELTCYTDAEKATVDWYLDHPYYALCTDWEATGGKLFGGDPTYIDFDGGGSTDFTGIRVSEDGEYTVTLWYGVGFANTDKGGGILEINVNGAFWDEFNFHPIESRPQQYEFDVELYGGDYDNVIQLKQKVDWPLIGRIQLTSNVSGLNPVEKDSYKISSSGKSIAISGLEKDSRIKVYSITGKLTASSVVSGTDYSASFADGLYIVNVNGKAHKVLVK